MKLPKIFKHESLVASCHHKYAVVSVAIRQGNPDFKTADVVIMEKCTQCDHIKKTVHNDMVQTPYNIYIPLDEWLKIDDKSITLDDVKLLLVAKSYREFGWMSRCRGFHPESNTFESGIGDYKSMFKEHRLYLKKYEREPVGDSFVWR